ncbi:MAG: hypothetical protein ABI528_03960 [bacterium]
MKFSKKDLKPGKYKSRIAKELKRLEEKNIVKRIWEKDPTVWKDDKEFDALIKNRLGWLTLPVSMRQHLGDINTFTADVIKEGYKYAIVMGMGGSSMCPEVVLETFGVKEGYLKLNVLDSTDTKTIFDIENSIDIDTTLFIVSSKSGSTIEVDSFFRYFFDKVKSKKGAGAGRQFIAITDPQTHLESLANENNFRKIFSNPADIGGRYSALSFFGLVPAALIGVDVSKLLYNAEDMMIECTVSNPSKNSGVLLGVAAGVLAKKGRDKLTFVISKKINSFGYWVEQLIAESTGKEGKGILPVEGEGSGKPSSYGKDRIFVEMKTGKESGAAKKFIKGMQKKNFPVINIDLKDVYDLGGQFFLWEFATAVMGEVLGINPFDEPNVKESKDNTSEVLKYYQENKKLPEQQPVSESGDIKIYLDEKLFSKKLPSKNKLSKWKADDYVKFFLNSFGKGDYVAIMAYIQRNETGEKMLQKIRELIRVRTKGATTLGYGPRFLHSTGQLHKGGPDKGLFIQIVSDDSKDIEIPGQPYSFGILKQAQATGDYQSLIEHKKKVLKINLGSDVAKGLEELYSLLKKAK